MSTEISPICQVLRVYNYNGTGQINRRLGLTADGRAFQQPADSGRRILVSPELLDQREHQGEIIGDHAAVLGA